VSADRTLDVKVKTDNGVIHSIVRMWAAELRGKPGHKITREELIAAWEQDPQLAGHVAKVKREVPKGSVMWISEAGTDSSLEEGPIINMTVRYG
jgi:hypothetical protein